MCATFEKNDGVERCTGLFPGNEPIRLPVDPSATQKYGAVTRSGKAFHTRTGDLPWLPPCTTNWISLDPSTDRLKFR